MTSIDDTHAAADIGAMRRGTGMARQLFAPLAAFVEAAAIVALAGAACVIWHGTQYGTLGNVSGFLAYGGLFALIFCGLSLARGGYSVDALLTPKRHGSRVLYGWALSALLVLTIGFLTKSTEVYSRGAILLFVCTGFPVIAALRLMAVRAVSVATDNGWLSPRRLLLVGTEEHVTRFCHRNHPSRPGIDVMSKVVLREGDHRASDLAHAVALARALQPDDIMIALPWSDKRLIDTAVDALLTVPSAIHLVPEPVLDRFDEASISKLGHLRSLELTRPPLDTYEVAIKRMFDLMGASVALALALPLFAVIALLIKLDSRGPVFFVQRRFGFNQVPFRIYKFRSMTTLDDGAEVPQATAGDPRITRVGRYLRRTNLDELPQLLNVILGDMSLVGPRPHALAHDRAFEQRIAQYARRHNMRPGITGWAQVNGFRGETDSDDKMRGRVEHDLWYIDNWSLLLDIKICLMTVTSPKAFRNAR